MQLRDRGHSSNAAVRLARRYPESKGTSKRASGHGGVCVGTSDRGGRVAVGELEAGEYEVYVSRDTAARWDVGAGVSVIDNDSLIKAGTCALPTPTRRPMTFIVTTGE